MKRLQFTITFLAFLLVGCGFKVVDRSSLGNFDISEITTNGEKRINYILKNKILFASNKNDKKLIYINLETSKDKVSKEKNIKNEVTKFEIIITVKVSYNEINNIKSKNFSVVEKGDYNVNKQYSQTLNNEKKLIEFLTDKIANEILEELNFRLNAI